MTNERWLKWAIARCYSSHGFRVSMRPAKVGNAMVDGIAIGPEALAAGYSRAVLVTTLRIARKLKKRVFQRRGMKAVGVDAKAGSLLWSEKAVHAKTGSTVKSEP
jgi:hypothetical protein